MLSDITHRKGKLKNSWLTIVYASTALEKSAHEIGYQCWNSKFCGTELPRKVKEQYEVII